MQERRGLTLVEVMVGIALLVVITAFLAASLHGPRETACRAKCSNNLRQIGLAIMMYCQENNGHYPRTVASDALPLKLDNGGLSDPNPFAEPGLSNVGANNVAASLFLLVRTQGLSTEVFTCPVSAATRDTMGGLSADKRSNFSDLRENLSYGYATPFSLGVPKYSLTRDTRDEFAIAADRAPGNLAAGVTKATDPTASQQRANSINHSREGQNVMYGDFHVTWERTPFVGLDGNNIYLGDVALEGNKQTRTYPISTNAQSQKPASPDDSVIVPWEQDN